MIIDCHSHLVPASLLESVRKEAAKFPSLRLIEEGGSVGFSFAGGKPTRPVAKPLIDVAARLAWMDEQHIERQVVGGWLDMFGYELPAAEGERWSRLANEHLKALTDQRAASGPARHRAAAGRRARRRGASRRACGGFSRRHDRHAAQGRRRCAR